MQLSLFSLLGAPLLALATTLILSLPTNQALPNPNTLPPSTHATLTTLGKPTQIGQLTTANTFVFHNLTAGSYLADVHCRTHAFAPLRVDISDSGVAGVWETYRGNDWENKGEAVHPVGGKYEVRVLGYKDYFIERSKFSVLSILKNPMILLGLVTCAIFMGMPYLVENMDPEMKAEWEESQKKNPMNSLMGAATGQTGSNPVGNFDMAAYLAGSGKKEAPAAGASGGNGKKAKR